ncbi:MAG: hypothetical protein JSV56_10085 [Methanomassiliicoccales archaeon]|nr:MAG: hypothetical protein JSV56_10085 [Methanomassiliicoccales archaeon]
MEKEHTQSHETTRESDLEADSSSTSTKKPNATVPLIITIIGIFCYLGVILPSVFKSSTSSLHYSPFDILLLVGGAALVGFGAYFWFKLRTKVYTEDDQKALEPA